MGGRRSTAICRRLKVTETTFYRWKSKYGGMDVSDAKRLKTLKAENARLKKLVAEGGGRSASQSFTAQVTPRSGRCGDPLTQILSAKSWGPRSP